MNIVAILHSVAFQKLTNNFQITMHRYMWQNIDGIALYTYTDVLYNIGPIGCNLWALWLLHINVSDLKL